MNGRDQQSSLAPRSKGALTAVLVLALLAAVPGPAKAAFPGANGKLAFTSDPSGLDLEVYAINADGSGQTDLTNNPNSDSTSSWSPNGQKIAFSTDRDVNDEIYVMNADGTNPVDLTNNAASDTSPAWSGDAQKLAFTSDRDGTFNLEIYSMNADGSAQTRLTSTADSVLDTGAAWSPDGQKIAFTTTRDGNSEIYVMNTDGSGQTNLTQNAATDSGADWSPDGGRIAFATRRDGNAEIYVMNADGTNPIRLTTNSTSDFSPAWSPDGQRLAFRTNRDGNGYEIYSMNADGTGQTRLTNNTWLDVDPDWQPVSAGYPRPQGAAQTGLPLVIAYTECAPGSANRTHGPTLTHPSCNPVQQASNWLTVGTNDANGFGPQSNGRVKITVCPAGTTGTGTCSTPTGMTAPDVRLEVNVSDVRCRVGSPGQSLCQGAALSDYTGQLQGVLPLRITDRHNNTTPGGTGDSATVQDLSIPFTVPCSANPAGANANAIGGNCNVLTRVNAAMPGAVPVGKRGNWELGQVRVDDGGPDGAVATADNTTFLKQGVFIP